MAKLSYKARKKLPASGFALPKERKYPIENRAHAKAALQMADGARSGKPAAPAVKAKVRAAVHRKFPAMGGSMHPRVRKD